MRRLSLFLVNTVLRHGTRPRDPAITCAEDIALFSLLHSVPNSVPLQSVPFPPLSNTLELLPVRCHKAYALSLHRERGLASTLAFLAQTEDYPDHIPAVCVEQCTNSTNLNILFAVNKSRWDDGDSILHDLRQGFDKIFSVLARVSDSRYSITARLIRLNTKPRNGSFHEDTSVERGW